MADPLERLTANLARLATHYDITGEWPESTLAHLTAADAWAWVIPTAFGGRGLDAAEQMLAYEAIAAGCMSSLLIITQRDAACEYIAASENPAKADLLPKLARHELMTTVGISQVTTSRQGVRPALTARPNNGGYVLNGFMPWVTAAVKSDFLVTAAVVEQESKTTGPAKDAQQILAMLPCKAKGVTIDRPLQLMALESSLTSEVHCKNVKIDAGLVLNGPAPHVVSTGRSTVKPLVVAVSGIGLAKAIVKHIHAYAAREKGPLADLAEELEFRCEAVRDRLYRFVPQSDPAQEEVPKTELRIAVNDLLMRLVVAIMTLGKGSGFVRQMEAQRLVREALFFLVWSAPEDVRVGTLAGFLNETEPTIKTMTY